MLRSIPDVLDPGGPPAFTSPDHVVSWIQAVDWLVAADRAVALHVDPDGRLTCVATAASRLQYLAARARDAMAAEAHECGAAAVIAVDVRDKLPNRPTTVDRRRHVELRVHLAVHGVALLDTVIVSQSGGCSVTGSLAYPLGGGLSWLKVHVPRLHPRSEDRWWTHERAPAFTPGSAFTMGVPDQPALWLVSGERDDE